MPDVPPDTAPDTAPEAVQDTDNTGMIVVIAAIAFGVLSAVGGTIWLLSSVANKPPVDGEIPVPTAGTSAEQN